MWYETSLQPAVASCLGRVPSHPFCCPVLLAGMAAWERGGIDMVWTLLGDSLGIPALSNLVWLQSQSAAGHVLLWRKIVLSSAIFTPHSIHTTQGALINHHPSSNLFIYTQMFPLSVDCPCTMSMKCQWSSYSSWLGFCLCVAVIQSRRAVCCMDFRAVEAAHVRALLHWRCCIWCSSSISLGGFCPGIPVRSSSNHRL